ncbi:ATP-binding cassette domain-containing protein [Nakamurella sp. A5-74]|uniref:ATP-binding cassette domain-containing protein n=1 Tax=Nakamurella sp. A5-74 TaxID=3158264 RepID=A0AAU8DRY6_9ACTN
MTIRFDHVTLQHAEAPTPVVRDLHLEIGEGEFILVTGRTGAGKSTLLQAINGLFPHFTGGTLHGRVVIDGRDTHQHPPRELADLVGMVGQDPLAGFVTDTVEEELAYAMEQIGIPPQAMRTRVEETLDLLGVADLRDRPLRSLSGGQQQRVAIGSVLTAGPRVLVLDEPTSALDPTSAEEVLAALLRLVHDLGVTVIVAEHRMERVIGYADRMLSLPGDGTVLDGSPATVALTAALVPPLVGLGRAVGWDPLPLTIRAARTRAADVRSWLSGLDPESFPRLLDAPAAPAVERNLLSGRAITVTYGAVVAVRGVDVALHGGEVAAVMGRNGSGKSSLFWALTGVGARRAGTVTVDGERLGPGTGLTGRGRATRGLVGLVPQTASDLLYLESVEAECAAADVESGATPGTCAELMRRLTPGIPPARHPRDLSEGQRLSLVLAVQLTARPRVILLDEPTRGLDYPAKSALARTLRALAADGHAIAVSTHDVEFAATVSDRTLVMAVGEIVADGPTAQVLAASPAFAPQVAKVLAPQRWLTVDQVTAALHTVGAPS